MSFLSIRYRNKLLNYFRIPESISVVSFIVNVYEHFKNVAYQKKGIKKSFVLSISYVY